MKSDIADLEDHHLDIVNGGAATFSATDPYSIPDIKKFMYDLEMAHGAVDRTGRSNDLQAQKSFIQSAAAQVSANSNNFLAAPQVVVAYGGTKPSENSGSVGFKNRI